MRIDDASRERFDLLLEAELDELPDGLLALLEEAPLIVEDRPSAVLLDELRADGPIEADELCGLHSGVPRTERSVEEGFEPPETIHLFRLGILVHAGGWGGPDADARIREEIRITLLHEIGHHFGLDEDDLADLGYA